MAQNLATLREIVQQLTAGQDQTAREIAKVESAVMEILMKMPEPPQPTAVTALISTAAVSIAHPTSDGDSIAPATLRYSPRSAAPRPA